MDQERLQYLLDTSTDPGVDVSAWEHESDRLELVEAFMPMPADTPQRGTLMALRAIAVSQILDDTPPDTWLTVQRLRDAGMDRDEVLAQLSMVIGQYVTLALDGEEFDAEAYAAELAQLPLPTIPEIARRLIDLAR
jgi:hypothetical protein